MSRAGRITANVTTTLLGGWLLTRALLSLPVEMPSFLDNGLRVVLHAFNLDQLANPDDMELLATLAVFVASMLVVGLFVWIANRCMRTSQVTRRNGS